MSFTKDPAAVLDYSWDWSGWLGDGETLTAATVTAPDGITVNSTAHDVDTVTVWLAGGVLRTDYKIVCHVTTSAGRQDERTLTVTVLDR